MEATTFGEQLALRARTHGDVIATQLGDRATTYAELDAQANRIANALIADGVAHGDRVIWLGRNSDQAVALAGGCARAGAVVTPLIWRLAPAEIAWIIGDAAPRAIVVEAEFAAIAREAAPPGCTLIGVDGAGAEHGWPDFATWRDAAPLTPPAVTVHEDDVVVQLYTSGTTGKPKGVMLSHANGMRYRAVVEAAGIAWLSSEPGETSLLAMPFGHIAGIGLALFALHGGQTMIIHREFDPGAILSAIETHRLKRLFLVPAALAMLLAHPRAAATDFSSLRYFSYGASPIPVELLKAGLATLKCGFVQLYGMTESWGSVVALGPEDHLGDPARLLSAGRAMPGVELRIVDGEGRDLPSGTTGEILVRGPFVMRGYWNRPEETARAVDGDGWLHTGDAGMVDADGYVFVQDRIKDMIVTGAENVYPAEVESAIFGHPAVADVAVIGVPDDRWGEAVKALVVLKPGADGDAESIIAHARARIAGFKCPKSVEFIAALPRNPSGKILRRLLREPYWAGRERLVN